MIKDDFEFYNESTSCEIAVNEDDINKKDNYINVYVEESIEADDEVLKTLSDLKIYQEEYDRLEVLIEQRKNIIKSFLKEKKDLVDKDGNKLASWGLVKVKPKLNLDKLKINYNEIYNNCLEESKPYRKFNLVR